MVVVVLVVVIVVIVVVVIVEVKVEIVVEIVPVNRVSRLTKTDRNRPERTVLRKYRNGLLWVPKRTGTDFSGYRNGPEQTSAG